MDVQVQKRRRIRTGLSAFCFALVVGLLFMGVSVQGAVDTCTWTGTTNGQWSVGSNWSGCDNGGVPEPGDSLVFPSGTVANKANQTNDLTLPAGGSYEQITFQEGAYSVLGNSIGIGAGGIHLNATNELTVSISCSVALKASTAFSVSGASPSTTLEFKGPIDLGGFHLNVEANGDARFVNFANGAVLSGAGNITKQGTGELRIFSSSPSWDGEMDAIQGPISAFASESLGSDLGATSVSSGSSVLLVGLYVTHEPFVITGDGNGHGALYSYTGTTVDGLLFLAGDASVGGLPGIGSLNVISNVVAAGNYTLSLLEPYSLVVDAEGADFSPGWFFGNATLTVSGDLVLNSGSSISLNLQNAGSGPSDSLAVLGGVQLNSAQLHLQVGDPPGKNEQFVVVSNDGSDPVGGTFSGLPEGGVITADGRSFFISYHGGDGNDVTLTAAPADLAITSQANIPFVNPGNLLVFSLNAANQGISAAPGVVITEAVPAHTMFNAGESTSGWNCLPPDMEGKVLCSISIGDLDPGQNALVDFAVDVDDPVPAGVRVITNTATVMDDGSVGDTYQSNNTAVNELFVSPLLFDDFEDGMQSWNAGKGSWKESSGALTGKAAPTAVIEAPQPWYPSGFSGCSTCSILVDLSIAGGPDNKVTLRPWYQDKANRVDILIKQEYGRIIVRHVAGGIVRAKKSLSLPLDADTMYRFQIEYADGVFTLTVDGTPVVILPDGGFAPAGNFVVKVKNTSISMLLIGILS